MRLIFVLLLNLFFLSAEADDKELVIASDPWCPFSCDKGGDEGIAIELTRAAFEPLGYKVNYKIVDYLRSLQELKHGNLDMVSSVDDTIDASNFIKGKEAVFPSNFTFFTKKGSKFVYDDKNEDCFKGMVIGVNGGDGLKGLLNGAIGAYINKYIDDPSKVRKVYGKNVHLQLIDMLRQGRIDLYIDTEQVAMYYISKANAQNEIQKGVPISKTIMEYIGFSPAKPNAKELMDVFDKRMAEFKKDGTYNKIMSKYGLQ